VPGVGNRELATWLGVVQRSAGPAETVLDPQLASSIDAERSSGRAISADVRAGFEHHFGVDFAGVRIHTDAGADALNRSVNAEAFTTGADVFFRAGRYDPAGSAGQELIAHELTHVVQQVGGTGGQAGRVSDPADPVEQAAARSARAYAAGLGMSPAGLLGLSGTAGNAAVARLIQGAFPGVQRQATAGGPGGPGGCFDLFQAIIDLLNEVAKRFNDALDDPHDLYRYHRKMNNPHPDGHGSWEGHRDRFKYDRDRLRQKIAEWDSDDDCRNYRLSPEQVRELAEGREYAEKEFPERPLASRDRLSGTDPGLRDRVRKMLIDVGVPLAFVGVMVVLVIAALADPEPFSKVALIIGVVAAVAFFALLGRKDEATTVAATAPEDVPPPPA
jgi:hypothetical protein